ncbi:hypothetical protein [Acuticoccus kandeliae]|uniref:hypothetical protein n=1 Tax=Acuticoccus kandeliae TaxID=2073160 RepID=UPI000D3E255D|nr:hypothetical protein [Acuticoccus kandeliae]
MQAEIAGRLALALEDHSEPVKPRRVVKAMPHPGAQPAPVRDTAATARLGTHQPAMVGHHRAPAAPETPEAPQLASASASAAPQEDGPRRIAYVHPEILTDSPPLDSAAAEIPDTLSHPPHGGFPPADEPPANVPPVAEPDLAMAIAEASVREASRTETRIYDAPEPQRAPQLPALARVGAGAARSRPRDFVSEHGLLLRDVRRTWMGSAFKRAPSTVLLISVRLARVPGADSAAAATQLRRTHKALSIALADLGKTYAIAPYAIGLCLADKSLRHTGRIAEAVEKAVADQVKSHPDAPVIFSAGVATMHRDDDPSSVVCLAEHCLRLAESEDGPQVVLETDSRVRKQSQRRAS